MSSITVIPVSEYLATAYRPDCDYVDGEVQERNLGEYDHGKLQFIIAKALDLTAREWQIDVIPELRVQVSSNRFRVPDVCVLSADAPREQIIRHPPLLCIEVLSPEDTIHRMKTKIQDFISMGVAQVWLFDPILRIATVCDGGTMVDFTSGELVLPGTPVTLDVGKVFGALDES